MSDGLRVIRLQSNNVMRLVAVDITPEGHLVMIGGKNGAGKSSVLNSMAMAIGGAAFVPAEPIRTGETEASVVLDLGDLIVTRKFSRDKIHANECVSGIDVTAIQDAGKKTLPCNCTPTFSETRSTLVVTNKDGARYPSPQAMLDKLLGKLTFDPLEFSRLAPKPQEEVLRRVVNLDTSTIDAERKLAFSERTMVKKIFEIKEAQLMALPKFEGVPTVEIPISDVGAEIQQAEEFRKVAEEAERSVEQAQRQVGIYTVEEKSLELSIKRIEEQLQTERQKLLTLQSGHATAVADLTAKTVVAKTAHDAVPDVSVLHAKLTTVETTNAKVRANLKHAEAAAEVAELDKQIAAKTATIERADAAKRATLEAVTFPVPGLGLTDDGVTFNGLPFAQASSSEQLRVSVAIGLALNPKLKVLLIRSGNLLDDDSLKLVADQAAAADAQLWCEWVTSDATEVQVMIEEGRVKA